MYYPEIMSKCHYIRTVFIHTAKMLEAADKTAQGIQIVLSGTHGDLL